MKKLFESNTLDNTKKKDEKDIIDVVEDFDYKTQSEDYNIEYKKWRSDKNNPYAYNYIKNRKERVFTDGYGYVESSQDIARRNVLTKIGTQIGWALIIFFAVKTFVPNILIFILRLFGVDVSKSFFLDYTFGNQTAVAFIKITEIILKYLIPTIFLCRSFKFPDKIAIPLYFKDKREFFTGISIMFAFQPVLFAISIGLKSLFSVFDYTSEQRIFSEFSITSVPIILYFAFSILGIPLLCEFFIHASSLHVLRQFGDWFAIISTAIFSVIIEHERFLIVSTFLMAVIIGVFVLRSGTIFMGIIMRFIYTSFTGVVFVMLKLGMVKQIIIVCIASEIVGIIGLIASKNNTFKNMKLVNNDGVPYSKKFIPLLTAPTLIFSIFCSLILG